MCDVSIGGGGWRSTEKRPYDVPRGPSRYVTLPLRSAQFNSSLENLHCRSMILPTRRPYSYSHNS